MREPRLDTEAAIGTAEAKGTQMVRRGAGREDEGWQSGRKEASKGSALGSKSIFKGPPEGAETQWRGGKVYGADDLERAGGESPGMQRLAEPPKGPNMGNTSGAGEGSVNWTYASNAKGRIHPSRNLWYLNRNENSSNKKLPCAIFSLGILFLPFLWGFYDGRRPGD